MSWQLYLSLSGMMFLEFAIWGAWSPVLASRLLGPLKMSGKQTGWIYGVMPIACIISPLIAGQIVDRWLATELFLAAAHLLGGVLLLIAARKTTFFTILSVMALYSLLFAPTLALVNSMAFSHLPNPEVEYFWVRLWGGISWVLVGWGLATWRRSGKLVVRGSDALVLAAVMSFAMGIFCFSLPHTPPSGAADAALPFVKALSMLKDLDFMLFLLISFVVTTQLQFYFLCTARYLEDVGVKHENIPAAMTLAQIAQVVAMAVILPFLLPKVGFCWTLTIGVLFWLAMYVIYARMRPRWLIISSMILHGLAYAFFFDTAFVYVNKVSPPDILGSAQALYTVITFGFGLFLGTQFTGMVMDHFKTADGKFRWRPIFLVPCVLMIVCSASFVLLFGGK